MRALPGRSSRTTVAEPATVTRATVGEGQRERILRATGELVAKRGYNDVSVELIVKRAHVGFKTFYKHFSNKEAAFTELFESVMGEAQGAIEAAIAETAAPWPERVIAALRGLFDTILSDPIIAKACIVEAPTVGKAMSERYEEAMKGLTPLLRQGRRESKKAAELPETLEDTLAAGVLWSAYQRLLIGEVSKIEALLPEAAIFVLRPYIGEREARKWAESQDRQRQETNGSVSATR